jgi:TolB-like protein/tetratricopeptide (TPR) repeat protein
MGAPDTPAAIRFGTFELDVRSRELRNGHRRIRLQDQPFEILHLMLQRPGHVVTREELCERLWPTGTFVDFEHSLNAAVKRLRAALGDDADHPTFVETLPRRGYRFIAPLEADDAAWPVDAAPDDTRLVVLPFTNLSDDPSQEYFSDGLTEELIGQLGPLCRGRIAVIARRSSMAFKGTSQRAHEIAQVLHARYLLEGSVRREADRVRITARLVDGRTETELWSDTHDRTVDDWLSAQADVAAHVARSLMTELSPRHLPRRTAPAPRAHQAYLNACHEWNRTGDEGFESALRLLEEAVRIAPDFAVAHGLLARLHVGAAEYYRDVPRQALEVARSIADRALRLDPANPDARIALGDVRCFLDFDWAGAAALYRDVLAANPSSEVAHRKHAFALAIEAQYDEAIRAADLARELDPLCIVAMLGAAWTRYVAGRYEDALTVCHTVWDGGSIYAPAAHLRAFLRLALGGAETAAEELEAIIERLGREPQLVIALAAVYASMGRRHDALALISYLRSVDAARYVSRYQLAVAYLAVDSVDAAFGALEQAWQDRDPRLVHLPIDPRFTAVRADARYGSLLARMHLAAPQGRI